MSRNSNVSVLQYIHQNYGCTTALSSIVGVRGCGVMGRACWIQMFWTRVRTLTALLILPNKLFNILTG
jgi:hypothetical protein